jgi:hypothetical protein
MSYTKLSISCCICKERIEFNVDTKDWMVRNDSIDYDIAFCPNHKIIDKWVDNQCCGCAGGWTSCNLWRDFAYGKHALTREDFESIIKGKCPKRNNGTLVFSKDEGLKDMDLSEIAPKESGLALAKAIKDYWEMFPERDI